MTLDTKIRMKHYAHPGRELFLYLIHCIYERLRVPSLIASYVLFSPQVTIYPLQDSWICLKAERRFVFWTNLFGICTKRQWSSSETERRLGGRELLMKIFPDIVIIQRTLNNHRIGL